MLRNDSGRGQPLVQLFEKLVDGRRRQCSVGARNGGPSGARRETTEVGKNQRDKAEMGYPWRPCYDKRGLVAALGVFGASLKNEEGDWDGRRENRVVSNGVLNFVVDVEHREDGISEDRVLAVQV